MNMMLAENIRKHRKERSLTQEQFAEVLGVTAGAVYKWEARLSVPDLELIVEMADFFDTSVDVLLGYKMKDNRLEATVQRLQDYRRRKDGEGLQEAEKAIKKYPHAFQVAYEGALLHSAFGIERGDKTLCRRALELLEQSRLLLPQNTDPEIGEQTLYGKMATAYLGLDEVDKATELLKAHNAGGLYNHLIGYTLARCERVEEAAPFLSEALAGIVSEMVDTVLGYMFVFFLRGDFASAQAILRCGIDLFLGLRKDDKPNYLDKITSIFLAALAYAQLMSGQGDEARKSLMQAKDIAQFFDESPSYDADDIRFIAPIPSASAYDDIGATAMDSVAHVISDFENEALSTLWKAIAEREEGKDHE